ncbi:MULTISPECIES: hypothetical protein [Deinococcus]|uniref:Uncharacterized protein n=1 Tax=Deinococcus rufus TaxID=2136097 RepID=A0ABV7Z405_9DEIO|nr:hypothetical protein [Deinococcus sp. AB2017081]WQE95143.1 hypothetical protein U2P90_17420 [Deinococcus sp. AB2017081]
MWLLALEIYFWAVVGVSLICGVAGLLGWTWRSPPPASPLAQLSEAIFTTVVASAALAPLYYLQVIAFDALQLPGWVIRLEAVLTVFYILSVTLRCISTLDRPNPVYVVPLMIAWHGLQILKSAADFGLV